MKSQLSSPFAPIQPMNTRGDLKAFSAPPFQLDKESGGEQTFENMFTSFMKNADDSQWRAGDYTQQLVSGQMASTHEMQITGAKSEVMLHLMTQVASKLSSATTTLFQMQI